MADSIDFSVAFFTRKPTAIFDIWKSCACSAPIQLTNSFAVVNFESASCWWMKRWFAISIKFMVGALRFVLKSDPEENNSRPYKNESYNVLSISFTSSLK